MKNIELCQLIKVALGQEKADLVIKKAMLVSVVSRELIENVNVASKNGLVTFVENVEKVIGQNTRVIDAQKKYLVPGFLDGHVHVESSQLTLTEFAKTVLPHGTTGIFFDAHEIANVLGINGVRLMLEEAKNTPLKAFATIPSCVPSTKNLETAGAEITVEDVKKALKWERVVGLGEMMNYPGVLSCDGEVLSKITATLNAGKVVEGHAAALQDKQLTAYASAGISSCHESTTKTDGAQRLRLGLYTMIREGTVAKDLREVIKCITEEGCSSRNAVLVTDDRDAETLTTLGHVDHLVRRAIEEGVDPLSAVQMATLNVAEHFQLSSRIGSITPGKQADMLVLTSLEKAAVETTIINGQIVAHRGKLVATFPNQKYPSFAKRTIHLKRALTENDFKIASPLGNVEVNVIGAKAESVFTDNLHETIFVENGEITAQPQRDLLKIAVVERHKKTGNIGLGLIKGLGMKKGAIATSVAHDCHNLITAGTNDHSMAKAVNMLSEIGGGLVAVNEEGQSAILKLPIAGLMSESSAKSVIAKRKHLELFVKELGCKDISVFMTLSFVALPVIPNLKITDRGLVDVTKQCFTPLISKKTLC